jgi:hypothetical protein
MTTVAKICQLCATEELCFLRGPCDPTTRNDVLRTVRAEKLLDFSHQRPLLPLPTGWRPSRNSLRPHALLH